jgi:hypothetical protein
MYRLNLKPNNCSLLIQRFNLQTNAYENYYDCVSTLYKGGACKYLTVSNGTLYTDKKNIYSQLPPSNYLETALTLDDTGMVRLQGIARDNNNQTIANTKILKGNATLDNYTEVHSEFNESIDGQDYQKINDNGWFFTITNETLTINNFDGSVSNTFPFKDVLFNQTGVYNLESNAPINFDQNYNKSLIHYPYVFQVDQFLPIFRIYDQNKTLLYDYSALPSEIPNTLDYLTCPDYTFAFNGNCIKKCPNNYQHYMNGTKGACNLSPSPVSQINIGQINTTYNASNTQFNYSWANNIGCPSNSTYYAYGCYCITNNTYFDRKKWICVKGNYEVI